MIVATKGADILKSLNKVQSKAVLKALTTDSYMLIKGLPGTGKTQTLVALVRLLNLIGKTLIITSQTHSAVDNLLLRLKQYKLPMLRLGNSARVHPQLREYCESELIRDYLNVDQLADQYASYPIVGVTCLGSTHAIFQHRKFDYCIVDEATQVMQPTVLRVLFACQKFVLVGDPEQLPPLVRAREARQRGADESLFQRLDSEAATTVLTLQYRMNSTITALANHLTYAGALQCANTDVACAHLRFETSELVGGTKWLQQVLHTHRDLAIKFIDTQDCAERSYEFACQVLNKNCAAIELNNGAREVKVQRNQRRILRYSNYCEAIIVFQLVKCLLLNGFDAERIGVISPYRVQVELLRRLNNQYSSFYAELKFTKVEVNTVDQYQGRDKDVIIYSCTKTGGTAYDLERSREADILEDQRRLTVAITRAKHKLIIVGDLNCLKQYGPFRKLIDKLPKFAMLKLGEDNPKLDFKWQTMFEELAHVIENQTLQF